MRATSVAASVPAAESSGAQCPEHARRVTVMYRPVALSTTVTCSHPAIPPLATTAIPARFSETPAAFIRASARSGDDVAQPSNASRLKTDNRTITRRTKGEPLIQV